MASVTTTAVHADVGRVWNMISGTTTTIVKNLITKAENTIKLTSSTTAGYEIPIRNYADFLAIQNVLASGDYVDVSIEGVSLGERKLLEMRDSFLAEYERGMKIKGHSVNGQQILFEHVNG